MKAVYPARKDRGHRTKGGARALLLKGCAVKFPGVRVPQVPEVQVVSCDIVYVRLERDHCCRWYC